MFLSLFFAQVANFNLQNDASCDKQAQFQLCLWFRKGEGFYISIFALTPALPLASKKARVFL